MSYAITKTVHDLLHSQLSNVPTGYNAQIAAIAAEYGIDAAAHQIDWTFGKQYFKGDFNPEDIDRTTPAAHHVMVQVWTDSGDDQGFVKFQEFSGMVVAFVQFAYSWRQSRLNAFDSETSLDATIDAMFRTVNGTGNTSWADPLAYNGRMGFKKSTLEKGGDYWRRLVRFRLAFRVER